MMRTSRSDVTTSDARANIRKILAYSRNHGQAAAALMAVKYVIDTHSANASMAACCGVNRRSPGGLSLAPVNGRPTRPSTAAIATYSDQGTPDGSAHSQSH